MPALVFSIIISDSPFVASGFAARKIKDIGLKNFLQKILNGEIDMIKGNYLLLFIISFLIIFTLAMINIYLNKRSKIIKWIYFCGKKKPLNLRAFFDRGIVVSFGKTYHDK